MLLLSKIKVFVKACCRGVYLVTLGDGVMGEGRGWVMGGHGGWGGVDGVGRHGGEGGLGREFSRT